MRTGLFFLGLFKRSLALGAVVVVMGFIVLAAIILAR